MIWLYNKSIRVPFHWKKQYLLGKILNIDSKNEKMFVFMSKSKNQAYVVIFQLFLIDCIRLES